MAGRILISNLWKSFNDKPILSDISIEVYEREKVGIVGPNGSGKTTLLRIIAGLEGFDSGDIDISGEIAMVFQEDILLPWMTAYENIELGLKYRGIDKKERRRKIYEISKSLGIMEYLDYYPSMLSGGTRRKISIARALVLKPDILLLDEPFVGIDIPTLHGLINTLKELPDKFDITLLVVSHQFTELARVVDKLYVFGGAPSKIISKIDIKGLTEDEKLNRILGALEYSGD